MSSAKRKSGGKNAKDEPGVARRAGKSEREGKGKRPRVVDPNVEVARELAAIAEEHGVSELVYETAELSLTIRRGEGAALAGQITTTMPQLVSPVAQIAAPAPIAQTAPVATVELAAPAQAAPAPAEDDNLHLVTSPFVGTFYRSPTPDSAAYVDMGQRVEKGQILCIVEAMKLMNEIEADIAGTIASCVVENAEPVEYGQALFKIDPA